MATVNRVYILVAFILSAIGSIFNFVSIGTEEWITGSTVSLNGTDYVNYVHYGLFQGTYKRIVFDSTTYQLTITCSFKHNVCALLCELHSEEREATLDSLITNTYGLNYGYANCTGISKFTSGFRSFEPTPIRTNSDSYVTSKNFINARVWLSTLLFVALAALLGLWTSALALINTVYNPYQYFLSVQSLFIYNGVAFAFTLLSIVVWGTMYKLLTFHNVSIYDTIVGSMSSDKTAYLGYSYWIGFISLAQYAGSIVILYYREYLNERDPKQQKVTLETDAADPTLFLF